MQPYEERVVTEKQELDVKLNKLTEFLRGPVYNGLPIEDRNLLLYQHDAMVEYSEILGKRIARFK